MLLNRSEARQVSRQPGRSDMHIDRFLPNETFIAAFSPAECMDVVVAAAIVQSASLD